MAFYDILFPTGLSFGSSGGPRYKTSVFTSNTGHEQRNVDWSNPRYEYDAAKNIQSQTEIDQLRAFFLGLPGKFPGFRYLDWTDYKFANETLVTADGLTNRFQMTKTYAWNQVESGESYSYKKKIVKPAWGSIFGVRLDGNLLVEGTDYQIEINTGVIVFGFIPTAGMVPSVDAGQYHVPVRLDTDHFDPTAEEWNMATIGSIPLVEDRNWNR